MKFSLPGQPKIQSNMANLHFEEIELKKVVELDLRARELMEISYDKEIERGHMYSGLIADFKIIVDCIRQFDEKFGNYQKLVRTLETN
jgi:hypothetical protein